MRPPISIQFPSERCYRGCEGEVSTLFHWFEGEPGSISPNGPVVCECLVCHARWTPAAAASDGIGTRMEPLPR